MKVKLHAKMVIGECINDEGVRAIETMVEESNLGAEQGFVNCQVLTETDGRMVVILTTWESPEARNRHHGSRLYRQFVERTQHLILGNYVVKHFENRATVGCAHIDFDENQDGDVKCRACGLVSEATK